LHQFSHTKSVHIQLTHANTHYTTRKNNTL